MKKESKVRATLVRPKDDSPKAMWEASKKLYEKLTGRPAPDRPSQEVMDALGFKPDDFD